MEWVAPIAAGVFVLASTLVTVIVNLRISRGTTVATKTPTTEDAWAEANRARASENRYRLYAHVWEDLYYLMRGALKSFARRMVEKYGDEAAALNLVERAALEAPTPEPIKPEQEKQA
jgi:hypothetical protein